MHELPKDLTNSLRSFRGSIYGRGQTGQGDQSARLDNADLEKGPEDYGDHQFDRALNTSQSSLSMQSATSAQNMDETQPQRRDQDVDLEKQEQNLRFEDEEHEEREDEEESEEHEESSQHQTKRSAERPRVNTSIDAGKNRPRRTPDTPGKHSILHGAHVKDLDPAADRLADDPTPLSKNDFYELMGMHPPTGTKEDMQSLMKPHGLYTKIVKSTRAMNSKYRAFSIAVYVFLVLQLIISAVFIILGSLRHVDTHITIAILGAISTVIAGGLALMQGQGLPFRLRKTRDELRNVIFAAEELYDDMRTGRDVLYRDIKKIREDYLRVLEDQRNNNPDMWNKSTQNMEQGVSRSVRGR